MQITLTQFEGFNDLLTEHVRMGDFMECEDPRAFIRVENRMFDACVEVFGYEFADDQPSMGDFYAILVAGALTGEIDVTDEEAY